jgi:hypothetical protein
MQLGVGRGWLLACVLLAMTLRLYRLDAQSLWYDEAVTANLAQRSLAALTQWTANDIQPPLYYYLVAGWGRLAGWSEWSLRWPSVFFGVLAVPLLAVLTQRLTGQQMVGWLAALLAACHPELVYYSQEARMYTLLVALGLLAAYAVVCGAWQPGKPRLALLYVLAATAAVYTHYFAFFLLLALVLAAWLEHPFSLAEGAPPGGAKRSVQWSFFSHSATRLDGPSFFRQPLIFTNLIVLLLYLPWLGAMLNRLAIDRSYWLGEFKGGEALRSVAIRFTSGETMSEVFGDWLLIPYGLITLVALVRLLALARSGGDEVAPARRTLLYSLLWLIAPVIGILTLAWFAPKFNPRYGLVALPGLLLLWSAGLAWPVAGRAAQFMDQAAPRQRSWRSVPAVLAVLALVAGALWSNANWFYARAYSKDDWRGLAEFLRPRIASYENVVLVSGHAWPVWHYYAPDIPVVRLPAIDVLDVDAVLTFGNTAQPLRSAFTETTGITGTWLIAWQDEVVDPSGIVPVQLELGGREKGQTARFWGLTVRRFSRLRAHRFVDAPPITQPLDINFAGQLALVGYHLMENGDLLLFWRRLADGPALAQDFRIAGETLATDGTEIARLADRRPSAYTYPVDRWGAEEVVMGHIPATDWLGPEPTPGTYLLHLTVYKLQNEQPVILTTPDGAATIELPITVKQFD